LVVLPEPASIVTRVLPAMINTQGPERIGSGKGLPAPHKTTCKPSSSVEIGFVPKRCSTATSAILYPMSEGLQAFIMMTKKSAIAGLTNFMMGVSCIN
jgi:hypothetical protein